MKTFHIEYWAWPAGARIKTEGRFDIVAEDYDDAIKACQVRWPEMNITSCEEKGPK